MQSTTLPLATPLTIPARAVRMPRSASGLCPMRPRVTCRRWAGAALAAMALVVGGAALAPLPGAQDGAGPLTLVEAPATVAVQAAPSGSTALPAGRIVGDARIDAEVAETVARGTVQVGTGSGVLLRRDGERGFVLTAWHVVAEGQSHSITFWDGTVSPARVVARDQALDLAVLVATAPASAAVLPVARQGEHPGVTSPVWVWGYPFASQVQRAGLSSSPTVSEGIISSYRTRRDASYLQTDAPINPGNSGGPVVTADGLVVGISEFKLTPPGDALPPEGLGFALSLAAHEDDIAELLAAAR